MLPKIEETPAICKLKIARSTEIPLWYLESDKEDKQFNQFRHLHQGWMIIKEA